jgi:gamma-glutamyltranspeptidase/glutathione hydrolase
MTRRPQAILGAALALVLLSASWAQAAEPWAAATVHPWATEAAEAALARGGNAIDAAVAAAATLNVVDGHNSGLGGGCLILIRAADGRLVAIDGRETAPAAARRDLYVRHGRAEADASRIGALASGVPGALAAYDLAQRRYGKLKLADVLLPAAELAERGFPFSRVGADYLAEVADVMRQFAASREIFFDAQGRPLKEGDRLVQEDLAATLRGVAEHGVDWFYRGPFAERCAAWMQTHGGIMTAEDFARYKPVVREPVVSRYRGYTIVGFPPPSSGGIHVAQILNVLENFPLAAMAPPERAHVMVEAMKLAFADRAYWLGDSDFVNVPRGLIDEQYAAKLAARIDPDRATEVKDHSQPPRAAVQFFGNPHTTHFSVADAEGNWAAVTATINTAFGSKVVIPGTGVVMNNEMDDFSAQPGVPNAFGLVGAEANAIGAGKRPLSSMSPTIVLDEQGRVALSCGAAGGPTIISQVVQILVNHLDLKMPLRAAVAAPRLHHQWKPDVVKVERAMPAEIIAGLKARGHKIELTDRIGFAQAVGVAPDGMIAVRDPRLNGREKEKPDGREASE